MRDAQDLSMWRNLGKPILSSGHLSAVIMIMSMSMMNLLVTSSCNVVTLRLVSADRQIVSSFCVDVCWRSSRPLVRSITVLVLPKRLNFTSKYGSCHTNQCLLTCCCCAVAVCIKQAFFLFNFIYLFAP